MAELLKSLLDLEPTRTADLSAVLRVARARVPSINRSQVIAAVSEIPGCRFAYIGKALIVVGAGVRS